MELTLGNYFLRVRKWHSLDEKTQYLNNCDLGKLEFGHVRSSKTLHFTVTSFEEGRKFGVGVDMDDHGLTPGLLLDLERRNLIIGYDDAIAIVNVPSKKIVAQFDLGYLFYQFHSLHHLGIPSFFLVLSEVGIKAITYEGIALWNYDASDVIISSVVGNDQVIVKLMDVPEEEIVLSLEDGREVQGDDNPSLL